MELASACSSVSPNKLQTETTVKGERWPLIIGEIGQEGITILDV